jgi:hypothetical protein
MEVWDNGDLSKNARVTSMSVKIESVFKEINGTAPDQKSIDKIMRAGRLLKLLDHDAFWLVLIAFEGQQAEVAKAMARAANLADITKTAAANTSAAAGAIRKILIEGAPWLGKAVQDAVQSASAAN